VFSKKDLPGSRKREVPKSFCTGASANKPVVFHAYSEIKPMVSFLHKIKNLMQMLM
jgi:hypothetical protein